MEEHYARWLEIFYFGYSNHRYFLRKYARTHLLSIPPKSIKSCCTQSNQETKSRFEL
jgi:hypothetical protein